MDYNKPLVLKIFPVNQLKYPDNNSLKKSKKQKYFNIKYSTLKQIIKQFFNKRNIK